MTNDVTVIPPTRYPVSDIERMARAIAGSNMFGISTIEQAMALCLVAQSEGRHPATAAGDYHIIQNRPSKKADAMLRDFLAGGGTVKWHALTDEIADATFSHPSGGTVRISWDHARAQKAEIKSPMWKKYPRQMLRSRTVSEGVRTVYPMATSGMYVPEEVVEFAPGSTPALPGNRKRDGSDGGVKSSRQAKTDGAWEAAEAAIRATSTIEELVIWRENNSGLIASWPLQWQALISDEYENQMAELTTAQEVQAAIDDADPPDLLTTARARAKEGPEEFEAWYGTLATADQKRVDTIRKKPAKKAAAAGEI